MACVFFHQLGKLDVRRLPTGTTTRWPGPHQPLETAERFSFVDLHTSRKCIRSYVASYLNFRSCVAEKIGGILEYQPTQATMLPIVIANVFTTP